MPSPTPRSASSAPPKPKEGEADISPGGHVRRLVLFLSIAIAGCSLDLCTKWLAFRHLGNWEVQSKAEWASGAAPAQRPPIWLIDQVFGFETSLNEGALFGMGQGKGWVFAVLSILALIGIVGWLFVAGAARDRLLTIALGCVTGGILGNLYDRAGLPGLVWTTFADPRRGHVLGNPVYAVRDWLHFKIDPLHFDWPIFNVADSLLVCGALALLCHALFTSDQSVPPKNGEARSD